VFLALTSSSTAFPELDRRLTDPPARETSAGLSVYRDVRRETGPEIAPDGSVNVDPRPGSGSSDDDKGCGSVWIQRPTGP
jgi:hypothetical protein